MSLSLIVLCAMMLSSCGGRDRTGELTTKSYEGKVFGKDLWRVTTVTGNHVYAVVDGDGGIESLSHIDGKLYTGEVFIDADDMPKPASDVKVEEDFVTVDGHTMSVSDARKVLRVAR